MSRKSNTGYKYGVGGCQVAFGGTITAKVQSQPGKAHKVSKQVDTNWAGDLVWSYWIPLQRQSKKKKKRIHISLRYRKVYGFTHTNTRGKPQDGMGEGENIGQKSRMTNRV